MGLVWLVSYAHVVAKLGAAARSARVRRILGRVTGTVMIVFGIRLALERP